MHLHNSVFIAGVHIYTMYIHHIYIMLLISEQDGGSRAAITLRPQDRTSSCYCPSVCQSCHVARQIGIKLARETQLVHVCASKSA